MDQGEVNTNRKMLLFANQLKAGRGLTMAATLIEGDPTNPDEENKFRHINEVNLKVSKKIYIMLKRTLFRVCGMQ